MNNSAIIRKFERFLWNTNKTSMEESEPEIIGTFYFDFEKGTETYIPFNKDIQSLKDFTEAKSPDVTLTQKADG